MFAMVTAPWALAQQAPETRRGSRIIDDSTKQVYGPTTSRFFYERDIFYNRKQLHPIDTVIRNFHRYNYVQRFENLYQDLGNIGTAIRPLYYDAPALVGAIPGFGAYDLYWDTEPVRYYDTKSPYSNMKVILGGKGRSITRATFSRNINPHWNFGFTYRGLFVDKQILRRGKGDRHVKDNYYDAYTAYETKDSTYTLTANFRRMRHQTDENGGVDLPTDGTFADLFADDSRPKLTDAESRELRTNFHIYHQYRVGKALQLYHTLDKYRQSNQFFDVPGNAPEGFYDYDEVDS
ncbi:MAG: putative porin, partial [Bacteroidia bacterium]|nr:putative porin [Bacteroidia bacterium]